MLAATAGQTRRVRPETVHYAKRAKRVDVRKLKENIWKNLDIVVPAVHDGERDEDAMVRYTCYVTDNCYSNLLSLRRTRTTRP